MKVKLKLQISPKIPQTYKEMVSFHTGFSDARMVFVFFFTLSESGMSLILTYGSLEPFGSIGIKLRPCFTVDEKKRNEA